MERTVPSTASDEIELYLRTVYSLLRSTTEVQIRALEEVHAGMNSLMHPDVRKDSPDMSAFIYSMLRLPGVMPRVSSVVLGQSLEVFTQHGFDLVNNWEVAQARARRRRSFFDGAGTLACLIASRSDIDDIVPAMVAYQIEWNKMHLLLKRGMPRISRDGNSFPVGDLASILSITEDDVLRLQAIWGSQFFINLETIAAREISLGIRLLSGSLSDYRRATHDWWANIETACPKLARSPVYFISSNTHSLVNVLTGFALRKEQELIENLEATQDGDLLETWYALHSGTISHGRENFLYYALKKAQQHNNHSYNLEAQWADELSHGIRRVPSERYFDVEAQVIELAKLDHRHLDPRLGVGSLTCLAESDALILNIDYPLGLAAYNILTKIAEQVNPLLGVYMMGKAATLNSAIGDVMIPNVVHDEQSLNTYFFQNIFTAEDLTPHLIYGTVLDNQKAVSVAGTFLQTARFMDVFYREGYTDIEMEAGPYLSAVYEMYRPKRHPVNEIVNLYGVPFEIGILHYASDTPLSKGRNLGAGTLSYQGMDATYATTIAILRRVFEQEQCRLGENLSHDT
jgi:hypothetical protein